MAPKGAFFWFALCLRLHEAGRASGQAAWRAALSKMRPISTKDSFFSKKSVTAQDGCNLIFRL